jgi:hypothetical protein
MTYASEFELIASLIAKDRFFMEVDEHGIGELLTKILRTCHDYSGSHFDAEALANAIGSHILDFTADGDQLTLWPEMEGDGFVDWEAVDAEEKDRRNGSTSNVLQPGECDPVTGSYNPNDVPVQRDKHDELDAAQVEVEARRTNPAKPVARDLPPLTGLPPVGV